jgi:hypothetical protein
MTLSDAWTYEESPHDLSALYYFGLNPLDQKAVQSMDLDFNVQEDKVYGQYYPTLTSGSTYGDKLSAHFVPVNALPFYWMLGKATDADGVKTITNMDGTALKPRLDLWQQTDTHKYHHYGSIISNLKMEWDGYGLDMTLGGKCTEHGIDTNTPTKAFPDDGANEIYSLYNHISSMTWNSTALSPLKLELNLQHEVKGYPDTDGQFYSALGEFSPISGTYHLQFTSTDVADIITDAVAQTTRSFVWKIDKAENTHYMQFTSNAKIVSMIATRDLNRGLQIWDVLMKIEGMSIESLDELANSFYQIA